jgi:heat shock protein HtpX
MPFIGIQSQIQKNNISSLALLLAFPLLLLAMVYAFTFFLEDASIEETNSSFIQTVPLVLIGVGIWFIIAWFFNTTMINMATGAKPLERTENKRVYNLLENLCIAKGITMPKLYVINDTSLNAYASGLKASQYTITVSTGIVQKLDDAELEAVLAHELSHILNRDVRLLIISIVFVGIFSFLAEMAFRSLRFSNLRGGKNGEGGGLIILIAIVISAVCYFISLMLRFGISRSREFMADAGSAEMTKNPQALASALRKISADPAIEALENRDIAQLFIDNPKPSAHGFSWDNLFATHPPIDKRIALLEQYT